MATKKDKGGIILIIQNLDKVGVRIVNTNKNFVKEVENEINFMLFLNGITKTIFRKLLENNFNEIMIIKKKEKVDNYGNNFKFLYSYHNWFWIAELDKKRIILCKIV